MATAITAASLIARAGERARREPEFAVVLAELIEAPTSGAGEYTRTAADALNRQRRSSIVAEYKAGSLTTAQVQRLLGLGTPQAVHQLRRRKKLVGLASGNATWFPAWQFEPGRLRPDLPAILEHLARFTIDPIAADRVMRLVHDDLGHRSISDALADPATAPAAWVVLGSLGA